MKSALIAVLTLIISCALAMDQPYEPGKAAIKIQADAKSQVVPGVRSMGITSIDAKFHHLNIATVKPLFRAHPSKYRAGMPDLSLWWEVTFPAEIEVWGVCNLLSLDDHIEYAEPIYIDESFIVPDDPNYSLSTYFPFMQAPEAWDIHIGGGGAPVSVLAITDTGVNWKHPDLIDNIWQNLGEDANGNGYTIYYNGSAWVYDPGDLNGIDNDGNGFIDDLIGWDFMLNAVGDQHYDPWESSGHGTRVTGIAASRTANTLGTCSISWNTAKIMAISCTHPDAPSSIYRGYSAIVYAAENNADIINCSWGGTGYSQANQDAVDYAYGLGSIIVAAAGNSNNSIPLYPAGYRNVVAVAALQNSGAKSAISNFGAYIDVGAPNSSVNTTNSTPYYTTHTSGATSYASPIAAGLAALMLSYHPTWTREQIIHRLIATCDPVNDVNPGRENMLGGGRLNAYRALTEVDPLIPQNLKLSLIKQLPPSDANGNKAVEPGETFSLNLLLMNNTFGVSSDDVTYTISTADPHLTILNNAHYGSIAAGDQIWLNNAFLIQAAPGAPSKVATLTLNISADKPIVLGNSYTISVLIHNGGVFIWEPVSNGRNLSGMFIRDYLNGQGYSTLHTTFFPSSFHGFEAIYLCFGTVNSYITRFREVEMYYALRDYLRSGGKLYIEGGDVVAVDMRVYFPGIEGDLDGHQVLWPLLGIGDADNGGTQVITDLQGQAGSLAQGIVFSASNQTQNVSIDHYTPLGKAAQVTFTQTGYGNVGVQNSGVYGQRSVIFSYALRELVDGDYPNTRNALLAQIVDFLESEDPPLPVMLTSFTAAFDQYPALMWTTVSESNMLGFNVLRSDAPDLGSAVLINPALIPAYNTASTSNYRYIDTGNLIPGTTLYYWLEAVSLDYHSQFFGNIELLIPNDHDPQDPPVPPAFTGFAAVYPNPFSENVRISWQLREESPALLQIYNIRGQLIRTLAEGDYKLGSHQNGWDSKDQSQRRCASGIYLVRLQTPSGIYQRKLLLVE